MISNCHYKHKAIKQYLSTCRQDKNRWKYWVIHRRPHSKYL